MAGVTRGEWLYASPDIVLDTAGYGMGTFKGREAAIGFFKDWTSSFEGLTVESDEIVDMTPVFSPEKDEQDIVDMTPDHLSVIIVANDKRRTAGWQYNGDGSLSGTVDDYHFRIGAYYLDDFSRPKRASIFCPYAIGFNAKESQQRVLLRSASAGQRWLKSKD